MLTLPLITKIFSKIALSHDAADHRRINTVALINNYGDLSSSSLGRTYSNAEEGTYWRRKQLLPDDLSKDPGVLVIMLKKTQFPDIALNAKAKEISIMSGFPKDCPSCPNNDMMTPDQIDDFNQDVLMSFIQRFGDYHEYRVTDGTTESIEYEHPDAPIVNLEDNGSIINLGYIERVGTFYMDMLGPLGTNLYRYARMDLKIQNCRVSEQAWDVNQLQGDNVGRIIADCGNCL